MIPKFRFWDIDEKHFIKDATIVLNQDGSIEGIEYFHSKLGHSVYNDISYYELMQSTGLKDKHGTEIYDKDIVQDSYGDVYLIEWLDGGFVLTEFYIGGYDHYYIDDTTKYKVIGNQYQHPHLLEE